MKSTIYTTAKKRLCTAHHLSLNSAITLDRSDSASRRGLVNADDHVAGDFDVVILHLLVTDYLYQGVGVAQQILQSRHRQCPSLHSPLQHGDRGRG